MRLKQMFKLILVIIYISLSLICVYGEYEKDFNLLKLVKPFLIPMVALFYIISSDKINKLYCSALFFGWMANLFFISQTKQGLFNGTVSYLIFWVLITVLILLKTRFPDKVSFLIGIIPFAFIYCCVFQLIYPNLGENLYLFVLNGLFMIFLGAYSLANYFNEFNNVTTYFLICILFFTCIQFLVSIELYYVSTKFFRPIAMMLFATGQIFLLRTLISIDKEATEEAV